MKTKTKRIGLAGVIVIGVAVVALLTKQEPPPQIITLPNGETYEFAGVTWSREAVPPTPDAQVAHRLPASLGNWLRNRYPKRLSQMNLGQKYPGPRLFIWYRCVGTNAAGPASGTVFIPTAVLADEAGVKGGSSGHPNFASSVTWSFVSFPVVPRRSRVLQCQFYPSGYGQEALSPFSTIRFPNPLFGQFQQWQAESLPIVRQSGDLEVRLDALTGGHPESGAAIIRPNGSRAPRYSPVSGGGRIQSAIDISTRSTKGTNESWVPERIELSDATGNVLEATSLSSGWLRPRLNSVQLADWSGYSESVEGTLWPDESAWRLKVELKRAKGFAPGELVTFQNVPVLAPNATNSIWMTNTVGGMQVRLEEHRRWDSFAVKYYSYPKFRLEAPDGFTADVVQVTSDAGEELSGGYGNDVIDGKVGSPLQPFIYVQLRSTNIAKTLNITWAVQKTRTVEFLAKPPKAE